jgi:hypothetical protein
VEIANRDWVNVHLGTDTECEVWLAGMKRKYPEAFKGKEFRIVFCCIQFREQVYAIQVF